MIEHSSLVILSSLFEKQKQEKKKNGLKRKLDEKESEEKSETEVNSKVNLSSNISWTKIAFSYFDSNLVGFLHSEGISHSFLIQFNLI